MKSLERIVLYIAAAVIAVTVLERARAQDAPPAQDPVMGVPQLEIQNDKGVTVIRFSATATGGGQIEVFASNGKRCAQLHADPSSNGEIVLSDNTGVRRANVGATPTGGYGNWFHKGGTKAAYIGADSASETGYFSLYGADKKKALEAYANKKGGILTMRNIGTDKAVATFGTASDTGSGMYSLASPAGKRGVVSYVNKQGGQTTVMNEQGKTAAFFGVSSNPPGNGLVYTSREDGSRVVEFGRNVGMGGYLSVNNGLGKRVVLLTATTGGSPGEGVLEISRNNGKLGVVARAHLGGSSVKIFDQNEKVVKQLR